MPDWSRRSFLMRTGAVGVGAVVAGRRRPAPARPAAHRAELRSRPCRRAARPCRRWRRRGPRSDDRRPHPDRHARTTSSTGSTPRSSSRASTPRRGRLRIHGLVERETTLTWDELLASCPMFEQYVTIACVSNEVGGNLVGNAKWTGVRLRDVLDIAGV